MNRADALSFASEIGKALDRELRQSRTPDLWFAPIVAKQDGLINITDIMGRELTTAEVEQHKSASVCFMNEEFCYDLARQHTEALLPLETRSEVRIRYEEIAQDVYSLRPKPLSPFQSAICEERLEAAAKLWTREERLLARDLAAVINDCRSSPDQQRHAKGELEELTCRIESRSRPRMIALIAAADDPGCWRHPDRSFKTTANRFLRDLERRKKRDFFNHLSDVIRRYLSAREKGAPWVASLPLMHALALEWLRDDKALWSFLEACLGRWGEIANPRSTFRRQTVEQQIAPKSGRDTKTIQAHLQRIGSLPEVCDEKSIFTQRDVIRQDLSRVSKP